MIGTHNSLTYLAPKRSIMNLFKGFWRCQENTLSQQLEDGVRYFDIRVTLDNGNRLIGVAHGSVDLTMTEMELMQHIVFLAVKNAYIRILVERGDVEKLEDVPLFGALLCLFPNNIVEIRVKRTWKILYKNEDLNLELKDLTFVPFDSDRPWWKQVDRWKNIFGYPIKRWVKNHKVTITKEQIEDPNVVYFVDYYNLNNIEYDNNSIDPN